MIDLKKITPFALDDKLNQDGLFIPFREDLPLMQFTGLHDKNGKEIYEGDILQSEAYGKVEVVWPEKYITSDNEDVMAWCVSGPDIMGLRGLDVQYYWEILGNLYENPDLINK